MPGKKLVMTILGGGSFFTPSFVGTMVQRPNLWTDAEVRLQDPNAERVAWVKAFCERYVARKGVPMKEALAAEILEAYQGQGNAIRKRDEVHKMAQANKAFAHFRW